MALFNWPFSVGDSVTDTDGNLLKVKSFEREGMVIVVESGKTTGVTKFGGNLTPVNNNKKKG